MIPKAPSAPQISPNPFDDPLIARRLVGYGVRSLDEWRALGRKRLALFGVTSRMVAELDALEREARREHH